MTGYRFNRGMRIKLRGREYIVDQRLPGGEIKLSDPVLGTDSILKESLLIQSLFSGDLELITGEGTPGKSYAFEKADFTQVPEPLRLEAKRRLAYVSKALEVKGYSKAEVLEDMIIQTSQQISDTNPPSAITLYRWIRSYEHSGRDIRALIPSHKNKGNRCPRLPREVTDIVEKVISQSYLTEQRATVKHVYDLVVARISHDNLFREHGDKLPLPNQSTVYRTVSQIDEYEKTAARYGSRTAEKMLSPVQQGPRPKRILERVEMDHTKLDLFVVDIENRMPIGKPWLTSAVDVYSKNTVGFYLGFEPPSYLSVMQCLRHAIAPKNYVQDTYPSVDGFWRTYGLPETLVVDNGKEFHSTHMEDACLQLGIVIQYAPPKVPWYKASIERYFKTLNTQLLHLQPGTSFSSFTDLHEYDPKKNAVIPLSILLEIVHKWIIDIYHQSYHRGIKAVPAKVWEKSIEEFPPALPPNKKDWDVLLGRMERRTVTRSGVEFLGLLYNSTQLAVLRRSLKKGEKSVIKYDPTDLSAVYVFDERKGNFLWVPAENQSYTKGLTLWQHNIIRRLARQEERNIDIVTLALAKEKIQQIVVREWNSSGKKGPRHLMARWLKIGGGKKENADFEAEQTEKNSSFQCLHVKTAEDNTQGGSTLTGLSNIGLEYSPQNKSSSSNDPKLVVLESQNQKKSKKRMKQALKTKLRRSDEPAEPAGGTSVLEDDLDMTDWTVDYNLPK